ncbi:hypothetical protein [Modestobacter sp. URMC 112]
MQPEEIAARARQLAEDIRARGHHRCLAYADATVAYRSDEDATATWLQQFLEGYLVPSDARVPDATVYSTADPELSSALSGLEPGQSAVGKHGAAEIPVTDSVTLVRRTAGKVSPPEEVHLLLLARERTVVLVTSGNPEVRREEGMQTLRAMSKWLLLERGWIPVHSACAAKDGRSICISGPKGSGKTSTLLNLLARNGCDLVAVDKFLLRDGGSRLEVRGIPGKIGIRVGSAIGHPPLLDWLSGTTAPFFPHLSADEVRHIAATNTPAQLRARSEKVYMTPAELAGLFGRSITLTAPLGLLLVPVFDLTIAESRVVRTEPERALRVLRESYAGLLSKGEGYLLNFFDLGDALLEQRLATLLGEHLPGVEAYEVHQNDRSNERTAELVAGLLS